MNVIEIITEEIQSLKERQEGVYTIPELAASLEPMGYDEKGQEVINTILQNEYQTSGDQGVIDMFTKLSGVEIDSLSRGRYMFKNLVDPNRQQDR